MYLIRITVGDRSKHIVYKTEKGARRGIERMKEKNPDASYILFEEVSTQFKQQRLDF